ncbi:Putative transposase (identified by ISEscan HMM) [Klebsiella pneumoniae]|nr:Putative transposase (identified by ISEscan HMM) [Klebsiella pneumoniae]
MNPFKGRHFQRDIILWAVRWYCKYGISYRELQEMLAERGMSITPRFTAGFSVMRLKWKNGCAGTGVTLPILPVAHVKVNGRWAYLYRAVDSRGRTVDFISLPS